MADRKLVCPVDGGEIEVRGHLRFYEQGRVAVKPDGAREWIGDTWNAPSETVELDEAPYYCRRCDSSLTLEELVESPGRPIRESGRWRCHLALAPSCLETACGMTVTGSMRLDDAATVDCPACWEALRGLLPAREPETAVRSG